MEDIKEEHPSQAIVEPQGGEVAHITEDVAGHTIIDKDRTVEIDRQEQDYQKRDAEMADQDATAATDAVIMQDHATLDQEHQLHHKEGFRSAKNVLEPQTQRDDAIEESRRRRPLRFPH